MGFSGVKVVLRSDGEPAMVALTDAVAVARRAEAVTLRSPVRESRCNGKVERAIRTWRGQFVSLKDHLESQSEAVVPADSPVLTWLVMHAAQVLTCNKVGQNGRTAYEYITGHRLKSVIVPFGEKIHFMVAPSKTEKTLSNWKIGVYLGMNLKTSELIVGNASGIYMVRSIRRMAEGERWSWGALQDMKMTVAEIAGSTEDGGELTVPARSVPAEQVQPRMGEFKPRQVYLKPKDFEKYEYTAGCPGCVGLRCGYKRNHSEGCRNRVEQAMLEDPDDKHRIIKAHHRRDHFIEEKVRQGDTREDGPNAGDENVKIYDRQNNFP